MASVVKYHHHLPVGGQFNLVPHFPDACSMQQFQEEWEDWWKVEY